MGLLDFFKKGQERPVEKKPGVSTAPTDSQKTSVNAQQPSQSNREYTIKSGDSLSKIAKRFYGNAGEWEKIYKANQDKIKDPNLIYPGQKIVIP